MAELYEKKNLFISTVVEPSIGISEKTHKTVDTEATLKLMLMVPLQRLKKATLIKP